MTVKSFSKTTKKKKKEKSVGKSYICRPLSLRLCDAPRRSPTSKCPRENRPNKTEQAGAAPGVCHRSRQSPPPGGPGAGGSPPGPAGSASPGRGAGQDPAHTPHPPSGWDRHRLPPAPCKQAAPIPGRHRPSEVRRQKGFTSSAKLRLFLRVSLSASSLHSAATKGTNESWMNSCTDCTHWAIAAARGPQPAPPPSSALLRPAPAGFPLCPPAAPAHGRPPRRRGHRRLSNRPAPPYCASAEPLR